MPRLLPRLLKGLADRGLEPESYRGPLIEKRRRCRSLWRPIKSTHKLFSISGRTHSLLLDRENILISPRQYARHKTMPPAVRLNDQVLAKHSVDSHDKPREMTMEERQNWTSPYLRMLSSRIRKCLISGRYLPADFLIRLTALRVPRKRLSERVSTFLVPDGLLHPKFSSRVYGGGHYVVCWKEGLKELMHKSILVKLAPNITIHSLFITQIGHFLRLRILQELEMLAIRLSASPRQISDNVILRRLSRSEWVHLKNSGCIPWEGVVAVLVVPPVNRDPQTKKRPHAIMTNSPPEDLGEVHAPCTKEVPLSTLLTTSTSSDEQSGMDRHLPRHRIPLYNSAVLFPHHAQRAVLHKKLCNVLAAERRLRNKAHKRVDDSLHHDKASHAFALFSTTGTLLRTDTVPLAIALWRLRMWEGEGFEHGLKTSWEL